MDGEDESEVPVWVNGRPKWLTGLSRKSTCDEVIYALLHYDSSTESYLDDTNPSASWAIFECWRGVERPLEGRTKILKVWQAWGAEQTNVTLSLMRLHDVGSSGEYSPRSRRLSRRRVRAQKPLSGRHCTCPQCSHRHSRNKPHLKDDMIKQILKQEKKVQELFTLIQTTDRYIEQHETRLHSIRVLENGRDYVQESYLESSMDDDNQPVTTKELELYIKFCDDIIQLEDQIQSNKSKIRDLTESINEMISSGCLPASVQEERLRDNEGLIDHFHSEITRATAVGLTQQLTLKQIMGEILSSNEILLEQTALFNSLLREPGTPNLIPDPEVIHIPTTLNEPNTIPGEFLTSSHTELDAMPRLQSHFVQNSGSTKPRLISQETTANHVPIPFEPKSLNQFQNINKYQITVPQCWQHHHPQTFAIDPSMGQMWPQHLGAIFAGGNKNLDTSDSNSDTGLSSMHSDEPPLVTLV